MREFFARKAYALKVLWQKLKKSWTARSLVIGPPATLMDLAVSLSLFHLARVPARWSAMAGVAAGSVFTFFANKFFAFHDKNPELAKPALRFILATILCMVIHGQLVQIAVEHLHVPFVVAKIAADILVFTIGQTLILRFVVFAKKRRKKAQH